MRSVHNEQAQVLPFSQVSFHSPSTYDDATFEYHLHHTDSQQSTNSSISPFAGPSALTHQKYMTNFNSIIRSRDLAYDLDLSPRIVPFIDIDARDHTNTAYHLNSYALDFFEHDSQHSLVSENQLGFGDIYNLLFDKLAPIRQAFFDKFYKQYPRILI